MEELGLKFTAHDGVSAIAAKVGAAVENVKLKLESIHGASEHASVGVEKLRGHFEGLLGPMAAVFGIGAGIVGFESLIKSAVDFVLNVQKLTVELNHNAQAGSAWVAFAEKAGIEVQMLARGFANVSKEANTGRGALEQMGIKFEDITGHLRPMNDLLMETLDWFKQNAGATNEATLAQQIFGRSSGNVLALLEKGREGFADITKEAASYGLILDDITLQHQLAFVYQMKQGEAAVNGLKIQLGMALMPAIAAVAQGLENFVHRHLQDFINGIQKAVSYIIGIGVAFGLWDEQASAAASAMADLKDKTDDTGVASGGAASGAKDLSAAIRGIRDAAKDATQAIDEQTRTIDAQIKSLEDAQKAANFESKQTSIKTQEAEKQKKIDDLKLTNAYQMWAGDLYAARSTQDQITQLVGEKAKLQTEFEKNAADEVTTKRIEGLKDQKTILAEQKRSIQDAAQSQIEAMQNAAQSSVDAFRNASAQLPKDMEDKGKEAAARFKLASDAGAQLAGQSFGDKIANALGFQFEDQWDKLEDRHTKTQGAGVSKWGELGKVIGTEIGKGISAGMTQPLADAVSDALGRAATALHGMAPPVRSGDPGGANATGFSGRAGGGEVRAGTPYRVGERGPETLVMGSSAGRIIPNGGSNGVEQRLDELIDHIKAIRYDQSGGQVYGQMAIQQTGG